MTMAFLMLGDPLSFPVLIFIWVFSALMVGIIVRRRLGAVLVALLVWLTMLPITASIAFALAKSVPGVMQASEGPIGWLPPLPSGFTLAGIFEAPIAGKIIKVSLEAMSGDVNGQMLVGQLIGGLVTDAALKPVMMVVGALIGVELGRLVQRRGLGNILPKPKVAAVKVGATLLIVCLCSTILIPSASGVRFGEDAYTEALIGALDKKGRAYVGDLFMDAGSTLSSMGLSDSDTDGLAAAFIVSHSGVVEEFGKLVGRDPSLSELSNLITLLPPTFAVVVYLDVPKEAALKRSVSVSQALSSTYGVVLNQLAALSIKPGDGGEGGDMPMITMAFYHSFTEVETLAGDYLTQFGDRGGFVDAVNDAVANGRLIPGETGDSASGAIFATGFINIDAIKGFFPTDAASGETGDAFNAFLSGSIDFSGGLAYWNQGEQPVGSSGVLDILNLLGSSTTPTYSSASDLSLLITAAPPGENIGGAEDVPNVKISTSVPLTQEELDSIYSLLEDMGFVIRIRTGEPEAPDFQIDTSTITLPLNVGFTKVVTGGETATVTLTVENRDTKPMTNVVVDDSASLGGYSTGLSLTGGSTTGRWETIPPGESRSITYTIEMDNPGVYTLQPARLDYAGGGAEFSDSSNKAETVASRPFFLFAPFELAALTWSTGSQLLDMVTGRGVIAMSVLTLGVFALVAYDGVKSYRRWRRPKEASEAPQLVSGDTSGAPQ